MKIVIEAGNTVMEAELNETIAGKAVYDSLPYKAGATTWGGEIYFKVPVETCLDETAQETVNAGDLAYWPSGRMFCIFFGPTPVSGPDEIRPASTVNIVGRVLGDPSEFYKVSSGEEVTLSRS